MTEIKSTMDLVMEKLARMDLKDAPDLQEEELQQEGMRLAAEFLRGEKEELAASLNAAEIGQQRSLRSGMVQALLRNIVLPRNDEQKAAARRAMEGLLAISGGSGDIQAMLQDMDNILERYGEHRKQMRSQLEQAFAQQMGHLEDNLARQTGVSMKLQPSQHPKFQEEWQRLTGDLDDQYGRAIEQYKAEIRQRLGGPGTTTQR
jgi:hypothetical protein